MLDAVATDVASRVAETGEVLLSTAEVVGRRAIRLCILNHSTTREVVDRAIDLAASIEVDVAGPRGERPSEREQAVDGGWLSRPELDPDALCSLPLFASLDRYVGGARGGADAPADRGTGEVVVGQFQPGRDLFVVLEGAVRVEADGAELARLGPGEFFGEMAVIDWGAGFGRSRSATVTAGERTRLAVLDWDLASWLCERSPAFAELLDRAARARPPATPIARNPTGTPAAPGRIGSAQGNPSPSSQGSCSRSPAAWAPAARGGRPPPGGPPRAAGAAWAVRHPQDPPHHRRDAGEQVVRLLLRHLPRRRRPAAIGIRPVHVVPAQRRRPRHVRAALPRPQRPRRRGPHHAVTAVADIDHGRMDGFVNQVVTSGARPLLRGLPGCRHVRRRPGASRRDGLPHRARAAQLLGLREELRAAGPDVRAGPRLERALAPVHGVGLVGAVPVGARPDELCVRPGAADSRRRPGAAYPWTDLTYLLHRHHVSWRYYVASGRNPDCSTATWLQRRPWQDAARPSIWNLLPRFTDVLETGQQRNIQPARRYFAAARRGALPARQLGDPERPGPSTRPPWSRAGRPASRGS